MFHSRNYTANFRCSWWCRPYRLPWHCSQMRLKNKYSQFIALPVTNRRHPGCQQQFTFKLQELCKGGHSQDNSRFRSWRLLPPVFITGAPYQEKYSDLPVSASIQVFHIAYTLSNIRRKRAAYRPKQLKSQTLQNIRILSICGPCILVPMNCATWFHYSEKFCFFFCSYITKSKPHT